MKIFDLPLSSEINRVIPKNSFDSYTNTRQKKLFSELVDKIRWLNKLSYHTVNLPGKDVEEIQLFEITLKKKAKIDELLHVIDRAIPYNLIFIVLYGGKYSLSASVKHSHPTSPDNAVIDWTFQSDWLSSKNHAYELRLRQSLDITFNDFCRQLSGKPNAKVSISELISFEQQTAELRKTISQTEILIRKQRQFNKKVELNLQLQKLKADLATLASKS